MWTAPPGELLSVLLVGGATYVTLVALTRLLGKRTLSQLNAYDLVVSVALGSIVATALLDSSVPYLTGVVALALLLGIQWLVAFVTSRVEASREAVVSRPTAVAWQGRMLPEQMREQRLAQGEVEQALRRSGCGSVSDAAVVVLESDGGISVITHDSLGDGSALGTVRGIPGRDD